MVHAGVKVCLPYLVFCDLLLDIVLQQVTKALLVASCDTAKLLLEDLLVEQVAHAETAPGHLGAVCWACKTLVTESLHHNDSILTNTLPSGT